jgi:hypothetical protein
MYRERLLWWRRGAFAAGILLGAISPSRHAAAQPSALIFDCQTTQMLKLSAAGEMVEDAYTALVMRARRPELTFVASDGSAVFNGNRLSFRIVQRASLTNDLVAIRELAGPASYVAWVLRIRPWLSPATFLLVDETTTYSGTCRGR